MAQSTVFITFSLKTDYLYCDNSLVPQSQTGILPCDTNDKHTDNRDPVPKSSQGKVFGRGEQTDTDRGTLRKTIIQNEQGHYVPIPHTELSSRIEPPIRKKAQKQILDSVCKVLQRFQEIKRSWSPALLSVKTNVW